MLNILYEDNHLIVVEKPPNLPVQADASGDADLLTLLKDYIKEKYQKPGAVYLGLVHRLDRPVGGVMVFARTSKAAARLSAQFASRSSHKRYAALVSGLPMGRARLSGFLAREEDGNASMTGPEAPGAKTAELSYERLTRRGEVSLLDVWLLTGRHHQIRCQLADAGLPIWGDQRYNAKAVPGEQIALWAYALSFEHPTKKEPMRFVCLPHGAAWRPFETELRALGEGVRVVYADADILACDKQAGLGVAQEDGGDALETRLSRALGTPVFPVHRLDVATTGLVLFARNELAKQALDDALRERTFGKFYRAQVHGHPAKKEAELRAFLEKDEAAARVFIHNRPCPGAKEIITRYRVLSEEPETSLLEVELVTGRTHQIRAHLAHEGFPLVGDERYGDREKDRRQHARALQLRAVRLELFFPKGSYLERLDATTLSLEDEQL